MGQGLFFQSQLPQSQDDVDRYSMTAPGDLIQFARIVPVHGADPDEFGNTTELFTGWREDGTVLQGKDAHSDVFDVNSTAWKQMLEVLTGGVVETARTPQYSDPLRLVSNDISGFYSDGEEVDIE